MAALPGNSGPADGDGPSSVGPVGPMGSLSLAPGRSGHSSVRRGPGRPRLRPTGPGNQGYRIPGAHHHAKKIQRSLPVPLRSQQLTSSGHKASSSKTTTLAPPGTSPATGSSSQASTSQNFTPLLESRPFGFYTQQQQQIQDSSGPEENSRQFH